MANDEYIIEQLEGVIDILDFIIKSKQNDKIKDTVQQEIENISQQQDLKLKDSYYDKLTELEGKYELLKLENEKLKTENKELKERIEKQKIIFFPWDEYEHPNPYKIPMKGHRIWF